MVLHQVVSVVSFGKFRPASSFLAGITRAANAVKDDVF